MSITSDATSDSRQPETGGPNPAGARPTPRGAGAERTRPEKDPAAAAKKCRPHVWRVPEIGDDGLMCENCPRKLDYGTEMTTLKYVTICNAYADRHGAVAGNRFRTALVATWAAAGGRKTA